jgi:hypothetical protein
MGGPMGTFAANA